MQALGHKNIKNTLLYVQLEEALFQGESEYVSKVAKTEKDVCNLVETVFEYFTDFQDAKILERGRFNITKTVYIARKNPCSLFIYGAGVGFEPTNAYAIRSLALI